MKKANDGYYDVISCKDDNYERVYTALDVNTASELVQIHRMQNTDKNRTFYMTIHTEKITKKPIVLNDDESSRFIEGDIFKIDHREYRIRNVVQSPRDDDFMYWLEPIIYRGETWYVTGGENRIYYHNDLLNMEYLDINI